MNLALIICLAILPGPVDDPQPPAVSAPYPPAAKMAASVIAPRPSPLAHAAAPRRLVQWDGTILTESQSKGLEPGQPGHIGVSVVPGEGDDPRGLLVVSMEPGGVAESIGIRPQDRILAVDANLVTSFSSLVSRLKDCAEDGDGDANIMFRKPDGDVETGITAPLRNANAEEGAKGEGRGPNAPPATKPGDNRDVYQPPSIDPAGACLVVLIAFGLLWLMHRGK